MTRPIDGDALKSQVRHMPRTVNPDLVQYSLVQAIIENAPTLTPQNEPKKCTGCYYLNEQCAPCAHCVRAAGYADYYRRPPERQEDTDA